MHQPQVPQVPQVDDVWARQLLDRAEQRLTGARGSRPTRRVARAHALSILSFLSVRPAVCCRPRRAARVWLGSVLITLVGGS